MNKVKINKMSSKQERAKHLFTEMPIWKALIKMAIPSIILMLVFGSYMFFDSVLSINFAHYDNLPKDDMKGHIIEESDMIRIFMAAFSPINSFILAFSFLFAIGVSTRVSINKGAGRYERAKNTLRTGSMLSIGVSIILIPILIFGTKPWIHSQYDSSFGVGPTEFIAQKSFDYALPIVIIAPLTIFNQMISSLLRTEARNKQLMIALITPVFLNLTLDYLFMGVANMGIEGGAYATVIATGTTTLLMLFFIWRTKESLITFKNLFSLKFKILSIIGIALVGASPFLRNMAQSITYATQAQIFGEASKAVYHDPHVMINMMTGIMPIYILFFPVMFGFVQAAMPISSFNYGAKNFKRVREVFLWTILYATITILIIYFGVAWGLAESLGELLQVKNTQIGSTHFNIKDESLEAIKYIMLSMFGFVPAIAAMIVFSSTDRIGLNMIGASMQGLILFWPVFYGFGALVNVVGDSFRFLIWLALPVISALTSLILMPIALRTLHNLPRKKQMTLDERIEIANNWFSSKDFREEWKANSEKRKEEIKKINAKLAAIDDANKLERKNKRIKR